MHPDMKDLTEALSNATDLVQSIKSWQNHMVDAYERGNLQQQAGYRRLSSAGMACLALQLRVATIMAKEKQ